MEEETKFKSCSERTCRRRNELLNLDNFYKFKEGKYGRRAICKECYHIRYGEKITRARKRRKFLSSNPLTQEQREMILYDFGNKCALTQTDEKVQLDHFVPLSWGSVAKEYGIGGNTCENMLPLNEYLNKSKNNNNPFYWIKEANVKFNIDMEKWNVAVAYIASKHHMSPLDFEITVNNCFLHVMTRSKIKYINKALNEKRKFPPYHLLNSLLQLGINIKIAVNKFGNQKSKRFICQEETINYINNVKKELTK